MTTQLSPLGLRYGLAQAMFDRAEYQRAAEALEQLIDDAAAEQVLHATTDVRTLLARAYFHSAQLGRAERVLRELLEHAPTDDYARLLLGRTLQRQGRHDEARPELALARVLGGPEPHQAWSTGTGSTGTGSTGTGSTGTGSTGTGSSEDTGRPGQTQGAGQAERE